MLIHDAVSCWTDEGRYTALPLAHLGSVSTRKAVCLHTCHLRLGHDDQGDLSNSLWVLATELSAACDPPPHSLSCCRRGWWKGTGKGGSGWGREWPPAGEGRLVDAATGVEAGVRWNAMLTKQSSQRRWTYSCVVYSIFRMGLF